MCNAKGYINEMRNTISAILILHNALHIPSSNNGIIMVFFMIEELRMYCIECTTMVMLSIQ